MSTLKELIEAEQQDALESLRATPLSPLLSGRFWASLRSHRAQHYGRLALYLVAAFSVGMIVAGRELIALYPTGTTYAQTRSPSQDAWSTPSLLESYQRGELQGICALLEDR